MGVDVVSVVDAMAGTVSVAGADAFDTAGAN